MSLWSNAIVAVVVLVVVVVAAAVVTLSVSTRRGSSGGGGGVEVDCAARRMARPAVPRSPPRAPPSLAATADGAAAAPLARRRIVRAPKAAAAGVVAVLAPVVAVTATEAKRPAFIPRTRTTIATAREKFVVLQWCRCRWRWTTVTGTARTATRATRVDCCCCSCRRCRGVAEAFLILQRPRPAVSISGAIDVDDNVLRVYVFMSVCSKMLLLLLVSRSKLTDRFASLRPSCLLFVSTGINERRYKREMARVFSLFEGRGVQANVVSLEEKIVVKCTWCHVRFAIARAYSRHHLGVRVVIRSQP